MLLDDIQLGKSFLGINDVKDLLFYFKVFDVFTKDEMKEIFLKNVSIDTNTDEPMSEEMFNNSMYAEILKDYDLPLNDLSMKYYKRKIADEV